MRIQRFEATTVQEALQKGPGAELAVAQLMGGVGAIAPTGSAQAVLNLTAVAPVHLVIGKV